MKRITLLSSLAIVAGCVATPAAHAQWLPNGPDLTANVSSTPGSFSLSKNRTTTEPVLTVQVVPQVQTAVTTIPVQLCASPLPLLGRTRCLWANRSVGSAVKVKLSDATGFRLNLLSALGGTLDIRANVLNTNDQGRSFNSGAARAAIRLTP